MVIHRFPSDSPWLRRISVAVLALILAACGTSGHSSGSPGTSAPPVTGGGTTPATHGGATTTVGSSISGKSASVTAGGYQYRASLNSPGVTTKTTFTTDDGTGGGGTAVDAPPGKELVVATLRFTNTTDRTEPFALEPFLGGSAGSLPFQPGAGEEDILLAVPQAQAAALGIQGDPSSVCAPNGIAPNGYCDLYAMVGAYSPAPTGSTQFPQLAPGATFTVTLLVAGGGLQGQWVPENAPVQAIKVYVEQNCTGSAICWAALN